MLKLAFATIPNGGGTIGRGCTLDPFEKVMRCIDFDKCTTDKNGNRTCPVVVTPYGRKAALIAH